jgi:hypothetical protein
MKKLIILLGLLIVCGVSLAQTKPEMEWTDTQYPSYITRLNYFGERPDWSHDGKKVLFVGRSFGDVYEIDVETGKVLPVTHHYYHGGYLRATYLSNGDILLLGPEKFDPTDWRDARFNKMQLWVLSKKLDSPPVPLDEFLWEGAAVSRTQLKISWAKYPDKNGLRQLMLADIDYASGVPKLINKKVVLDNANEQIEGTNIEPQNFVPGSENKLTVQVGGLWKRPDYKGAKVFLLDLNTGEFNNISKIPMSYDEPEGVFPDGQYTLVESSQHDPDPQKRSSASSIDLYKLKLDESQTWERMTYFNEGGKFKASNPVVSDDGKFIAFMVAVKNETAGVGHGVYIFDIEAYEKEKSK